MGNRGSRFLEISQAALNEMREGRGGEVESGRQSHAETWKMDTKAAIISHSNVKQEKQKHDKKRVQRIKINVYKERHILGFQSTLESDSRITLYPTRCQAA